MADRDVIVMSLKELERVGIIERVLPGELTQKSGAEVANLSERQIRRIVRKIREEGRKGISHKSRGKASNRKLAKEVRRVMDLYHEKYNGFGPAFAAAFRIAWYKDKQRDLAFVADRWRYRLS